MLSAASKTLERRRPTAMTGEQSSPSHLGGRSTTPVTASYYGGSTLRPYPIGYALMVSRTLTIPGRMVPREPSARLRVVSPAGYCPPAGGASPISPRRWSSRVIADCGRRARLGSAGTSTPAALRHAVYDPL